MSKHLVFVYGTLRRTGVRAMPEIFPAAEFTGEAQAHGRLYDMGAFPGLFLDESGPPVFGEVYEVDEEILHQLDEIEASSNYRRRRVEVSLGDERRVSWVYVPDPEFYSPHRIIESGDWINYVKTTSGME